MDEDTSPPRKLQTDFVYAPSLSTHLNLATTITTDSCGFLQDRGQEKDKPSKYYLKMHIFFILKN